MIRTFQWFGALHVMAILMPWFGAPLLADEGLKSRFLKEGPESWMALSQQARQLKGKLVINEVHKLGKDARTVIQEVEFMINDPNAKKVVRNSTDRVWCFNKDYAFSVVRSFEPGSAYAIDLLESRTKPLAMTTEDLDQMVRDFLDDVHAPWTLLTRPLASWIERPGFIVEDVEPTKGPGGEVLALVRFRYEPEGEPEVAWLREGSSLTLDPGNFWCLTAFTIKKPGRTIDATFEYDGRRAGLPFLREKKEVRKGGDSMTRTLRFEELSHEVVPPAEFRLSAYGFPEPRFEPQVRPLHLGFFFLAGLCLAAFVFMRVRSRRHRMSTAGSRA